MLLNNVDEIDSRMKTCFGAQCLENGKQIWQTNLANKCLNFSEIEQGIF